MAVAPGTGRTSPILTGAVVQGTAHLATGRGCQDAFKAVAAGQALVLAVADGAGSRDRSALGAHLAVDTACRLLAVDVPSAEDDAAAWRAWIGVRAVAVVDGYLRAVRALLGAEQAERAEQAEAAERAEEAEQAEQGDRPPQEGALAATLAAAVLRPPWVAFLSVGDCFGTVLTRTNGSPGSPGGQGPDDDERCRLALPPRTPPVFLSTPGVRERVDTLVLHEPDLSGVVLATDGCAPLALDHPSVHGLPAAAGPLASPRFFCSLAAELRANGGDAEPLRALLSGPQAARSGDDLTVLCALLTGGAG